MFRALLGVPVLHAGVNPVNGLTNNEIISTEKTLMDNFNIKKNMKNHAVAQRKHPFWLQVCHYELQWANCTVAPMLSLYDVTGKLKFCMPLN